MNSPNLTRTLSIHINDKSNEHDIINFLSFHAKNVYNINVYHHNIFNILHNDIFKTFYNFCPYIIDKFLDSNHTDYFEFKSKIIFNLYNIFHKKYKDNIDYIRRNNDIIYGIITNIIKDGPLVNHNFEYTKDTVDYEILMNNKLTKNNYLNKFIEKTKDNILKTAYLKNYNKVDYQIRNKIKVTIKDIEFIKDVMQKKKIKFKSDINWKNKIIKDFNMHFDSGQTYIGRFVRNDLGKNKDVLPSDVIANIIKKSGENYKSYFASKKAGLKANTPKYLDKTGRFVMEYARNSEKGRSYGLELVDNKIRLTVGKYVSENYQKLYDDELVCLNNDAKPGKFKYIPIEKLIKSEKKMSDKEYFNVNNHHSGNIISSSKKK